MEACRVGQGFERNWASLVFPSDVCAFHFYFVFCICLCPFISICLCLCLCGIDQGSPISTELSQFGFPVWQKCKLHFFGLSLVCLLYEALFREKKEKIIKQKGIFLHNRWPVRLECVEMKCIICTSHIINVEIKWQISVKNKVLWLHTCHL